MKLKFNVKYILWSRDDMLIQILHKFLIFQSVVVVVAVVVVVVVFVVIAVVECWMLGCCNSCDVPRKYFGTIR